MAEKLTTNSDVPPQLAWVFAKIAEAVRESEKSGGFWGAFEIKMQGGASPVLVKHETIKPPPKAADG